jgi:hydrogenase nickel incorporation protein HypA/HybF
MTQIVDVVLKEAEKRGAERVTCVEIEIGELSFLGEEQLAFAFEILSENNILKGAELKMTRKDAEIECKKCGFIGKTDRTNDEFHTSFTVPVIKCPKCNGEVRIISGRDCIVKNIKLEIPEGDKDRR